MRTFLFCLLAIIFSSLAVKNSEAQRRVTGVVREAEDADEFLPGVTVSVKELPEIGAKSNTKGEFSLQIPDPGKYTLIAKLAKFEEKEIEVDLQTQDSVFVEIRLYEEGEEHHGPAVVVTGTRQPREITNTPIRVDFIDKGEVQEEQLFKPSNVAQLLSEITGVNAQVLGGLSNTMAIRIQGMRGRYTQFLVNGIPNFGGLSTGFSLFEVPPLNLRQVELVKGPSSVLYGADAIGGVVNFLTKEPEAPYHLELLSNVGSLKTFDGAGFFSGELGSTGVTAMGVYNYQPMVDVDGDKFADVAKYDRKTFGSEIFKELGSQTKLRIGSTYSDEYRLAGVIDAPASAIGQEFPYLEQNKTDRLSGVMQLNWKSSDEALDLSKKEGAGVETNINESSAPAAALNITGLRMRRHALYSHIAFDGDQYSMYIDGQYTWGMGNHDFLAGFAYNFDEFADASPNPSEQRSYIFRTPGIFLQDEIKLASNARLLLGSRLDYHNIYGLFYTPRVAIQYRPIDNLSLRFSSGTGWKAPTVFMDQLEERIYSNIKFQGELKPEKAFNGYFDASWSAEVFELPTTLNVGFFYTQLNDPLSILDPAPEVRRDDKLLFIETAKEPVISKGVELFLNFDLFDETKFFVQYTFTHATEFVNGSRREVELNPRHKALFDLIFEDEDLGTNVGIDLFVVGEQVAYDTTLVEGRITRPYATLGIMLQQKLTDNILLFANAENIFDVRQTKYEQVYHKAIAGEVTPNRIYMPLTGRSITGGIKITL